MQTSIDIKNYLLALLKIAYEFTATCCPTYEKDPQAELYAEILAHADKTRIDEISVVSNHFMDREFSILAPYVGNNEYRHILLLTEIENKLVCVVKLFDTYGVYIRMSDSSYGKGDTNGIIAINDFKQQKCDIYTIEEVLNRTLHGTRRDYVLSAESQAMVDDILQDSKKQVGFACVAGQNLLFDSGGKQIGTEEYFLLQQDKQSLDDTVITNDGLVSTYHYPENYYYMLMPQKKLIRVDSIKETILVEKI